MLQNRQFVFGVILLVVILFFDNSVAGGIEWLRNKLFGEFESAGTGTETSDDESMANCDTVALQSQCRYSRQNIYAGLYM